jgi:hypothetical protein
VEAFTAAEHAKVVRQPPGPSLWPLGVVETPDNCVAVARARETGAVVTIPATALAQAVRRPERQARLARPAQKANGPNRPRVTRLIDRVRLADLLAVRRTALTIKFGLKSVT